MPRVRRVTIETVSACNLRCLHCAVSLDDYVGKLLRVDDFRKIVPVLERWRPKVNLSGHGETFMHKRFKEMFLDVVNAGCPLEFQTNGVLLDKDMVDFLVPYGGPRTLRAITVSLDAAEKELFETIRRMADWDQIISNLSYFRDRKEALGKLFPLLQVEFVAMVQNIHQLPDLVELSHRLGAYQLLVSDLTEYPLVAGQNIRNNLETALPHLLEAIDRARKIGLTLDILPGVEELLHPPDEKTSRPDEKKGGDASRACPPGFTRVRLCTDPWEFMFLKADGRFLPCCWIDRPMVDTDATDVLEAWEADSYKELRRAVCSADPPKECTACFARPWTHVPSVAAGKPQLAYPLYRSYRFLGRLRKRFQMIARYTGRFTNPGRIGKIIKAVRKG